MESIIMQQRNLIPLFSLFFLLGTSCKDSPSSPDGNTEDDADASPDPEDTRLVDEGWFLKKTDGKSEKFFAIGAWNIPGYDASAPNETEVYNQQTRNINIAMSPHPSKRKGLIFMSIEPGQILRRFLAELPVTQNRGAERGFYESMYLRKIEDDPDLLSRLDDELSKHVVDHNDFERAYLPIDEVSMGLASNYWHTPSIVGDVIYKKLKVIDPNTIVFSDLAGHGRGSTFFFEKRYLKDHPFMPESPPYESTSASAQSYAANALATKMGIPLLAFLEGLNGVPTYEFTNSNYSYTSSTPEELKSYHFENIKAYAEAYRGNGNAFGINAFMDFGAHPDLAGTTVDAIRAGLDDPKVPIWLFFDGAGYAKPDSVSVGDYANLVRCQMYTSIIHGATGIFFWNDSRRTAELWDELQPTLEEIKGHVEIFKLKTLEKKSIDDLHLMIKEDESGKRYIMVSNTSKTSSVPLEVEGVEKDTLEPLEVYVAPI